MFTISIQEDVHQSDGSEAVVQRYAQTVDTLDMQAIIAAVNNKPRARRSDAGKARAKTEQTGDLLK